MRVPELVALLSHNQLFGFLDKEMLEQLAQKFTLEFFSHGECLLHSQEINNDFFIIFSGTANVTVQDGVRIRRIATLKRGDCFGENAILHSKNLNNDIYANGDLVVAKLDGLEFKKLVEDKKEFGSFARAYTANQALQSFLKNFGSFGALSPQESAKWLSELTYEAIKKDKEIVFKEGDAGDKFYIVASGGVEIIKNINGKDTLLITLGEGKFFGEMALMSDAPRAATARCVNETQLISIDKVHFMTMVNANPALASKIRNIIDMYKAAGLPKDAFIQSKNDENLNESKLVQDGLVLQKTTTPLGSLSCVVSTICELYHIKTDGKNISEYIKMFDFEILKDAFYEIALIKATRIALPYKKIKKVPTPFVAHLKNRAVIVYGKEKSYFKIADPIEGFLTLHEKEFQEVYNEEIILIEKPQTEDVNSQKLTLHSFSKILSPYKKIILEILSITVFISVLSLLPPIFIRILIDDVLVQRNENMLIVLIIALIVVAIFSGMLFALRSYLQFFLSSKLQVEILGKFFSHLVTLPLSFFIKKPTADILGEFDAGRDAEKHMSKIVMTLLVDGSMSIAFLIALFMADSKLFLVFISFVSILGSMIAAFIYYVRKYLPKTLLKNGNTEQYMLESIHNILSIKIFCAENSTKKQWETKFINKLTNLNKYITIGSISNSAVTAMRTLTTAVILAYASILALSNEISIGQALAFNMIAMLALVPIGNIIQIYHDIDSANFYASGINKVYAITPEAGREDTYKPDLNLTRTDIEFKNLYFSYENTQKLILSNFSLNIAHGEYVAVIGKIGSGKSTLINMITGVNRPNSGQIIINGVDISKVNLNSLRSNIGVVIQDTNLFSGTIKDNIGFGTKNATMAQIIEAATLAGTHEFIMNLSNGYDTVIGERGYGLSGGQKRLISIARALVSNPPILIMDEPTNDLDIETEQVFKENLKTISFGRTMIIITHRSSLIRDADKIVVFDEGEVVEVGTHSKLIANKGYYFYLCAKQIALS
jgi:ATP-binding cassette, subfamily B, bacterial HlyB/CyaB